MSKSKYSDEENLNLEESLETEEWISDLPKNNKKQYEEYARSCLRDSIHHIRQR